MKVVKKIILFGAVIVWLVSLFYFYSLTYNPFIIRYEDLIERKERTYTVQATQLEDPAIQRFYYTDRKKDEEQRIFHLEDYEPFRLHIYVLLPKSGPEDNGASYGFYTDCSDEYERRLYAEKYGEIDENEPILFNCRSKERFHSSSIGSVWARHWESYEDRYTSDQFLMSPDYDEYIPDDNHNYNIYNNALGKSVFVIGDEKGRLYDDLFSKFKAYVTVIVEYSELSPRSIISPLYISVIGVTLPVLVLAIFITYELINYIMKLKRRKR